MSRTHAIPDTCATPRPRVAARVGAAVLGGYVFAWGLAAALTSGLFAAGTEFHDAEFLGIFAGLLAYLVALLWVFAVRRLWMAWTVLIGGGVLLAGVASFVQSLLA